MVIKFKPLHRASTASQNRPVDAKKLFQNACPSQLTLYALASQPTVSVPHQEWEHPQDGACHRWALLGFRFCPGGHRAGLGARWQRLLQGCIMEVL